MIEKCFPRNDLMEIAWETVPAMWEPEIARLMVSSNPRGPCWIRQMLTRHSRQRQRMKSLSRSDTATSCMGYIATSEGTESRRTFRSFTLYTSRSIRWVEYFPCPSIANRTKGRRSTSTWTRRSSNGNIPDPRSTWPTVPQGFSPFGIASSLYLVSQPHFSSEA